MTVPLASFSSEDQKIIGAATGVVRARKGKGRELKQVKPYGSMRLKAGLSLTQFLHGKKMTENEQLLITDRISGTEALGVMLRLKVLPMIKNQRHMSSLMFLLRIQSV